MRAKILLPYLVALGLVALTGMVRGTVLSGLMGDRSPFGLFTLAILCSAWMGGLGPGLFATTLSVLGGIIFFITPQAFTIQHGVLLGIFSLNGILISIVCESLRRSRQRAIETCEKLEHSQHDLRESESRFRQLADSAPVMIWMSDAAGLCSWLNRPWLEFTGQTLEKQTGEGWMDLIHPDDLSRCRETFQRHFETRTAFEIDYRLLRHDGTYRWIITRGMPLFSGDSSFLGYMGGCIDIHERKEAEKDGEALLKLEQRARLQAERTALLKDEFLATVSHEMRTPLTAMLGWVQLLRSGTLSPDTVPQALETIERNARAQAKLIDDLLDMSRILSGRLRLDMQQVQPVEIVEAAISAAEPAATAKRIRLVSKLDPNTGLLTGDPIRLQQIIWNLLNNAIKFTPQAGSVTVGLQRHENSLEIFVTDTGEGITPEFLPHVFDRFRQQDASTVRRHQGLGLGLAIVKQLVELHGGSVSAKSEGLGKGSTLVVDLPITTSAPGFVARGPATPPNEPPDGDEPLPSLLGAKVLIVDDDADARELLRSILAQSGASVRTASSAAEAMEQFRTRRPDVLVSDIGMPGRDGYDLIREIRSLATESGAQIPALALTAFARSDDRRRAISAGFHMHLAKPVEPAELVTVVSSLASR